jgi:hypothetical protein
MASSELFAMYFCITLVVGMVAFFGVMCWVDRDFLQVMKLTAVVSGIVGLTTATLWYFDPVHADWSRLWPTIQSYWPTVKAAAPYAWLACFGSAVVGLFTWAICTCEGFRREIGGALMFVLIMGILAGSICLTLLSIQQIFHIS